AILAAILFPVFAQARDKARQAACMSNLKQIGIAVTAYCGDYDDRMPPAVFAIAGQNPTGLFTVQTRYRYPGILWAGLIQPYTKNSAIFTCPSAAQTFTIDGFPVDGAQFGFVGTARRDVGNNPSPGAARDGLWQWMITGDNTYMGIPLKLGQIP